MNDWEILLALFVGWLQGLYVGWVLWRHPYLKYQGGEE